MQVLAIYSLTTNLTSDFGWRVWGGVKAFSKRIKFPWRWLLSRTRKTLHRPSWFRSDWFRRFCCLCWPASCRIRKPPATTTNGPIPASACGSSSSKGTTAANRTATAAKTDGDSAIVSGRPADIRRAVEGNRAKARAPRPITATFSTSPTATVTITPCPGRRCTTWCIKNVSNNATAHKKNSAVGTLDPPPG